MAYSNTATQGHFSIIYHLILSLYFCWYHMLTCSYHCSMSTTLLDLSCRLDGNFCCLYTVSCVVSGSCSVPSARLTLFILYTLFHCSDDLSLFVRRIRLYTISCSCAYYTTVSVFHHLNMTFKHGSKRHQNKFKQVTRIHSNIRHCDTIFVQFFNIPLEFS